MRPATENSSSVREGAEPAEGGLLVDPLPEVGGPAEQVEQQPLLGAEGGGKAGQQPRQRRQVFGQRGFGARSGGYAGAEGAGMMGQDAPVAGMAPVIRRVQQRPVGQKVLVLAMLAPDRARKRLVPVGIDHGIAAAAFQQAFACPFISRIGGRQGALRLVFQRQL